MFGDERASGKEICLSVTSITKLSGFRNETGNERANVQLPHLRLL